MRLSLRKSPEPWEINRYIWLQNIGDEHLMLHLASGDMRLDKGRKYRFRRDVLDDPAVQALLDARKLAIKKE